MSEKHSIASRARWLPVSSEDRKKRMSYAAKIRWSKLNRKERLAYSQMMLKAKLNKKKNVKKE